MADHSSQPPSASSGRQNAYHFLVFGILLVGWITFSGLLDAFHLTLGVLSCAFVTWISGALLFERRDASMLVRIRQGWRLLMYFLWMLWEIFLANVHLLRLAFGGRRALQPQIVRFDCKLESDFEKFLLANSITLTPGTITMKILGNRYYVHAISNVAAAGLEGEMERRIAAIFRPDPGSGREKGGESDG